MMDTIFFHGSTKEAEPPLPEPNEGPDAYQKALVRWRAWASFRYVGDPTKRLFTGASGFKGGYEKQSNDIGVLPADQTMVIERVRLVLKNVRDNKACVDALNDITLGLMINNAYEKMYAAIPLATSGDGSGEGDIVYHVYDSQGAQVAARMGFYVTALIGRKAKDTLEATHGAHLSVHIEGTLTRDVEDAPKEVSRG